MSVVPLVGFGTFNAWANSAGVAAAVVEAIKVGYKHIDCASLYDNEKEIGAALADVIKAGVVARSDLFVVSKLPQPCHERAQVRPRLEETLRDLQLDYVDLYLIHWPEAWTAQSWQGRVSDNGVGSSSIVNELGTTVFYDMIDVPVRETWEALQECVDAGLVKHIGTSNFSTSQLRDLLSYARIKPVRMLIAAVIT